MKYAFKPIGIVHSPFKKKEDIKKSRNIDPMGFDSVRGEAVVYEEFSEGLRDVDDFSHIILIFAFHKSAEKKLLVHPPHDGKQRGVFATRSPHRPNPIGLSVLQLIGREENVLHVLGVDMIDGTPILDIKPYTPRDQKREARFGWLERWTANKP